MTGFCILKCDRIVLGDRIRQGDKAVKGDMILHDGAHDPEEKMVASSCKIIGSRRVRVKESEMVTGFFIFVKKVKEHIVHKPGRILEAGPRRRPQDPVS